MLFRSYADNTRSIITVGDNAPQNAGTYVKFGTGDAVYVVDSEVISAFDFGLNDLISLTINDAAENTDNNEASSIVLSGSAFPQSITLEPNADENYSASFRMTSPVSRLAAENESSLVAAGIRDLYALSVKYVNPSAGQLSEAGLAEPYARLEADYPDTSVTLTASKPDSDGSVNLMLSGKNVVYTISADKVPWVNTSYEKLCNEYVLYPKMTALSGISLTAGGKTYEFELNTREAVTTDDQGSETASTVTSVFYNGDEIQLGDFSAFYDKLALIVPADVKSGSASGSDALRVEYAFADGSTASVRFVDNGGDTYAAVVNGEPAGHAYKTDVNRAVKGISEMLAA